MEKPNPKNPRLRNAVLRFLNARVSLPSWLFALSSAGLAWAAMFLLIFGPIGLGAFGAALPFTGWLWAPLLFLSTNATIIGLLFTKRVAFLKYGAFASFLLWIFGALAFIASGQALTAAVVATPWTLFYAYAYLASHFRDETGI